jgi:hypothetical protein
MAERNMEHIRLSDGFRGIAILRTYPEIGTAGLQAGCRAGLLTRTSLLAAWTPPVQPVWRPALLQEMNCG